MSNEQNTSTPQHNIEVRINDKSQGHVVQLSDLAVHKGSDILGTVHRGGFPVLDAVKDTDLVRIGNIEMPVRAALQHGYLVKNEKGEITSNDGSYTPSNMRDSVESGGTFADDALGYAASQLGSDDETAKQTLSEMLDFVEKTAPADVKERLNRQLKTPKWREALDEIHREFSRDATQRADTVTHSADTKAFLGDAYRVLSESGQDANLVLSQVLDGNASPEMLGKLASKMGFESVQQLEGAIVEQSQEIDALLEERLCAPAGISLAAVSEWAEQNVPSSRYKAAINELLTHGSLRGFRAIRDAYVKATGGRGGDVKLPQGAEIRRRPDGTETVQLKGLPEMRVETARRLGYLS
jgi:hypothetical protein